MKVDLFSITQGGKRTISFMSQALGLMADLDIGTENLRWMGDMRFIVGLFRGGTTSISFNPREYFLMPSVPSLSYLVIPFRPCPVKLSIKVAEQDKHTMVKTLTARQEMANKEISPTEDCPLVSLPSLKYSAEEEDGWITIDKPLLYIYAGQGPYVGRFVLQRFERHPSSDLTLFSEIIWLFLFHCQMTALSTSWSKSWCVLSSTCTFFPKFNCTEVLTH
jgi:sphingosine kinase